MAPKIRFSDNPITWIVYKYGELKSISLVMGGIQIAFPSYQAQTYAFKMCICMPYDWK